MQFLKLERIKWVSRHRSALVLPYETQRNFACVWPGCMRFVRNKLLVRETLSALAVALWECMWRGCCYLNLMGRASINDDDLNRGSIELKCYLLLKAGKIYKSVCGSALVPPYETHQNFACVWLGCMLFVGWKLLVCETLSARVVACWKCMWIGCCQLILMGRGPIYGDFLYRSLIRVWNEIS